MKSSKLGRYLGVSLGVGIASFAIYQMQPGSPESFEPVSAEFRSLSDWSDSQTQPELVVSSNMQQVNFDDDGQDQMVLPATDEITANQLQLAAELTGGNLNDSMEIPPTEQFDDLVESEFDADDSVLTEETFEVALESPTEGTMETTQPEQSAQPAESRLHEIAGSSWRKNPFLDGNPSLQKNKTADSEIAAQTVPAKELVNAPAEPIANSVSSVVDFSAANSLEDNEFQFQPSAEQAPTPTIPATDDVTSTTDYVSDDSNQTGDDFDSAVSTQSASPTDQYSIAPLQMGLSESVAQRAAQHIEYGKALARRSATHAARQEFYAAIRVLAQSNDEKTGIHEFTHSLANGINALKEAEDFMVYNTETQIGLNVAHVVETHRSNLLSKKELVQITPIRAMQKYFAYAQQQLEIAGGRNVVAAEALHCLGKLHSVSATHDPSAGGLDIAKAIVYHRAALASDESSFRSANELGVLLARTGRLDEAKGLLKQALTVNPSPEIWNNLAKVHQRVAMGGGLDAASERNLAQLAQAESVRMMSQNFNAQSSNIQWMQTAAFNAAAPVEFHESVASKPAAPVSQAAPVQKQAAAEPKQDEKPKSIGEKFKSLF